MAEASSPKRNYRDELLTQLTLCLIGVLRHQYAENERALQMAPIVSEYLKPINADLLERMGQMLALLGQIQGEAMGDLPLDAMKKQAKEQILTTIEKFGTEAVTLEQLFRASVDESSDK